MGEEWDSAAAREFAAQVRRQGLFKLQRREQRLTLDEAQKGWGFPAPDFSLAEPPALGWYTERGVAFLVIAESVREAKIIVPTATFYVYVPLRDDPAIHNLVGPAMPFMYEMNTELKIKLAAAHIQAACVSAQKPIVVPKPPRSPRLIPPLREFS